MRCEFVRALPREKAKDFPIFFDTPRGPKLLILLKVGECVFERVKLKKSAVDNRVDS